MIFPSDVRALLEQTSGLKQAAADISLRYRTGRDKSLKTATEAAAYAATRMPATFGAVGRALELTLETLETPPETVLDVGAGTGAATLAAQQMLNLKSAVCLESAAVMRELGQKLVKANWRAFDVMADELTETADLVIASYMLNEVSDPIFAARKLWNATDSVLLIVESALPEAVALLQKIRADLVDVHDGQVQNPNRGQHDFIRLGEVDFGAVEHIENALRGGKIVHARLLLRDGLRQFRQVFAQEADDAQIVDGFKRGIDHIGGAALIV